MKDKIFKILLFILMLAICCMAAAILIGDGEPECVVREMGRFGWKCVQY